MEDRIDVKPLPYKRRQTVFFFLLGIFVLSLPFLYLYATGYRFDLTRPTNLIGTGGLYIAVDRTGAEIFIDDELVRETRTFRKAFYAQDLDAGTHRVHVQIPGYHTWVKELPVTKHRVTVVESFNLPLMPTVRVVSPFLSATGTPIVRTPLLFASTTAPVIATTTKVTTNFAKNGEYDALMIHFGTTSTSTIKESVRDQIKDLLGENGKGATTTASTTDAIIATSTITANDVKLYMSGEDLFATWVGRFEAMPYYYCAPDFPRYSSSTPTSTILVPTLTTEESDEEPSVADGQFVMHPVQSLSKDAVCDPTIRIDRKWQIVRDFELYPGNANFVIVALEDGIYVVEIDDRSWQNVQPLIMGRDLAMHIENGAIYVYDGNLIYQVILPSE